MRIKLLFLILLVCESPTYFYGQNLILSPDFEEIVPNHGDYSIYRDTFYVKNWFMPTDGLVDIIRDYKVCKENFVSQMSFCVQAKSGNYCLGLLPFDVLGYMEHITGKLVQPLQKDKYYKVSFHLRFHGSKTPYVPKGIGFKLSNDSIVFKSNNIFDKKQTPSYHYLFETTKVYSDYSINEFVVDTTWKKYEHIYQAKGGERFITFGIFAYPNDEKIIKQFKKVTHNPFQKDVEKFIEKDKSLVFKRFNKETTKLDETHGYYLLDVVEVSPLDSLPNEYAETSKNHQKSNATISNQGEIEIPKGFFGDMTIELGVSLKPMEKYVLEYGKNRSVVIVNTDTSSKEVSQFIYTLQYPAKKLRKKPVLYYVSPISQSELEELELSADRKEIIDNDAFKGILYELKK